MAMIRFVNAVITNRTEHSNLEDKKTLQIRKLKIIFALVRSLLKTS